MILLRPWFLWLLLAWLPFCVWWLRAQPGSRWASIMDAPLLQVLQVGGSKAGVRRWLLPLFLLLVIVALAGPGLKDQRQASATQGNLYILLDNSLSMAITDLAPNRLVRAQRMALDWVNSGLFDKSAVVTYSASAHTLTPLTKDADTIALQMQQLTPFLMPEFGNRADLAFTHLAALSEDSAQAVHLLWLTDDIDNQHRNAILPLIGRFQSAHLVAVGTAEGGPIPLPNDQGYLRTEEGMVIVPTDTQQLTATAHALGLRPIPIGTVPAASMLARLDNLGEVERGYLDLGYWLLLPIVLLWLFSVRQQWVLSVLTGIFFMGLYPPPVQALELFENAEQRAYQAWQQQDFGRALELTKNPMLAGQSYYDSGQYEAAAAAFANAGDADGLYNMGNSYAHAGQYSQAIAAYEDALAAADHPQAAINKALLEEFLQQQGAQSQGEPGESNAASNQQAEGDSTSAHADASEDDAPPDASQGDESSAIAEADGNQDSAQMQDTQAEQNSAAILNQLKTPDGRLLQQKLKYQFQQNPSQTDSTLW